MAAAADAGYIRPTWTAGATRARRLLESPAGVYQYRYTISAQNAPEGELNRFNHNSALDANC